MSFFLQMWTMSLHVLHQRRARALNEWTILLIDQYCCSRITALLHFVQASTISFAQAGVLGSECFDNGFDSRFKKYCIVIVGYNS